MARKERGHSRNSLLLFPLWWVITLALLCLLPHSSQAGFTSNRRNKADRDWKIRKRECERSSPCQELVPEEAYNCVNQCISTSCYNEVYASEPLEDGEIDRARQKQFTNCLRLEFKNRKAKQQTAEAL